MKVCLYCGRENDDLREACHECGKPLSGDAGSTATESKRPPRRLHLPAVVWVAAAVGILVITATWPSARRFDGVAIRGTSKFNDQVVNALTLLRSKTPEAYQMVTNYIGAIVQAKHSGMAPDRNPPTFELNGRTAFQSLTWCASSIAHDSLHAKLYLDYLMQHPGTNWVPYDVWGGEAVERLCSKHQNLVLRAIGAPVDEIWWSGQTNIRYWEVDYEKRDW